MNRHVNKKPRRREEEEGGEGEGGGGAQGRSQNDLKNHEGVDDRQGAFVPRHTTLGEFK